MRSMMANWPAAGPSPRGHVRALGLPGPSAPVHLGLLGLDAPAGPPQSRALGVAALIAWVLTVSLGAYMARAWIGSGGLRRRRAADDDFPPGVLLGHASLALTGLLLWASYVASGLAVLAWVATGVIAAAIGLGVSTVTLWTPYPVRSPPDPPPHRPPHGPPDPPPHRPPHGPPDPPPHRPPHAPPHRPPSEPPQGRSDEPDPPPFEVTDEMLHALLSSPPPVRRRRRPQALIPLFHGIGAITTFLLAILTAVGTL
jgi:hypothetical protein